MAEIIKFVISTILNGCSKKLNMENTNESTTKILLSNKKRLSSQQLKEKQYKTQQQQIKSALAKVDYKTSNKKILFDSDEEETPQLLESFNNHSDRKKLFNESDSDESGNSSDLRKEQNLNDIFHIRSQFEGKKGQKLLALQTRFQNDERFQMDERFLESDNEDKCKEDKEEEMDTMDILEERKRNFEILQDVVGVQFPIEPPEKLNQGFKDTNKLRYDPTSEDAEKFELKQEPKQKNSLKKSKQIKQAEPVPIKMPEVSNDMYFQISSDLKDKFNQSDQGFCLLKQFSQHNEEKSNSEDTYEAESITKVKKSLILKKNVFKYDSSDEDETILKSEEPVKELNQQKQEKTDWKFFFSADDPRFQEGMAFFQRTETDDEISSWWKETRPKMLNIIHSKVKTYMRRNSFNNKRRKRR